MFDIYQDVYDRREQSPLWWHNKSSDLHASAGALWFAMNNSENIRTTLGFQSGFSMGIACWPVYQMLFGMAFELLLKAILVAKGEKIDYSHKLTELAKKAGVNLTASESDILTLLTESVVWEGRYPTPKYREHLEAHYKKASSVLFDKEKMGAIELLTANNKLDWEQLEILYSKIDFHFFEIYKS